LLPGEGETIPENASELVLLAGDAWPIDTASVRLFDSAGASVPVAVEQALYLGPRVYRIRLLTPLRAGVRYRLVGPSGCSGTPVTSSFLVGPPAPRPTRVGALARRSVQYDRRRDVCGTQFYTATVATFVHEPPPDLVPWLPLTYGELLVDGDSWLGEFAPVAGRTYELSARCDGDEARNRVVELVVTVAGELRDVTPPTVAPLACDAFVGCSVSGPLSVARALEPSASAGPGPLASRHFGAVVVATLLAFGVVRLRARRSSRRRR
jgi:hypothetical protein